MNSMVWKHNSNRNTFTDCNPGAADNQAKASFVKLSYNDAALTLKLEFKVHIPMYWVAATTVDKCAAADVNAKPIASVVSKTAQINPDSIMQAMVNNVFYSSVSTGTYCEELGDTRNSNAKTACKKTVYRDINSRDALVNEAAQLRGMSGPVVSQLVKALNPNTPAKRDVVSYLRGLLLKNKQPAKIVAAGTVGTAKIKKGP